MFLLGIPSLSSSPPSVCDQTFANKGPVCFPVASEPQTRTTDLLVHSFLCPSPSLTLFPHRWCRSRVAALRQRPAQRCAPSRRGEARGGGAAAKGNCFIWADQRFWGFPSLFFSFSLFLFPISFSYVFISLSSSLPSSFSPLLPSFLFPLSVLSPSFSSLPYSLPSLFPSFSLFPSPSFSLLPFPLPSLPLLSLTRALEPTITGFFFCGGCKYQSTNAS